MIENQRRTRTIEFWDNGILKTQDWDPRDGQFTNSLHDKNASSATALAHSNNLRLHDVKDTVKQLERRQQAPATYTAEITAIKKNVEQVSDKVAAVSTAIIESAAEQASVERALQDIKTAATITETENARSVSRVDKKLGEAIASVRALPNHTQQIDGIELNVAGLGEQLGFVEGQAKEQSKNLDVLSKNVNNKVDFLSNKIDKLEASQNEIKAEMHKITELLTKLLVAKNTPASASHN